ncbi:MAG TPA: amino acid adenylation domain-containing protein, partial [Longimicrobium sp.]
RPIKQDLAGDSITLELGEELTAELNALGRRHGTTLFMTVLAGWAAVLARLSGQADLVIGTPTANRGRAEIEGLIGFFVNILVVRLDLSGRPSVGDLLGRVKSRVLEAQQHQDIPFEQVVELAQPVRSLAHSPVFQVMFNWQNAPTGRLELPGLTLGSVGGEQHGAATFDMSISLQESGGRIIGGITYATALFEQDTVERFVAYLRRALEEMVAGERRPVERLELLPPVERARVVEEWNSTGTEYPEGSCLHELFEEQVERTPEAVAVVFEGESLTYAALNRRANRLAHHLRAIGVGPDRRVAISLERGPEMMVALLGVLKAGGAYVPLDPAYPADRLRATLEDSAPAVLLTQAALARRYDGLGIPTLALDADAASWAEQPRSNPARAGLTPDNLAYVIYTSGSTGKPKGVMNVHRGVVNLLAAMRSTLGVEPSDRLLAVTTLAFDISVLELFLPLMSGARVEILPRAASADPVLLREAIEESGATILQATPATWRLLVEGGWAGEPRLRALSGGEALTAELASLVRDRVGSLWNVYGPTETTIWSTAQPVEKVPDGERRPVSIGAPLANTRVYVLDAAGEPVPVGVAGELYIGGAGVARGYLDQPDITAERFVADAYSGEAGARLYRTGDRVRWLADGTLEFLGRNDFQVKIRGFRIELGEIESRLAAHPAVREATVAAREDVPGDTRLVAYWVGEEVADVQELRAHLSERLPEHMVPAAYVHLAALPLTPNGKLDRKALPAPDGAAYVTRGYEAPVGETEEELAAIWSEVLRVDRVGRWDDFFALGGHSLRAVQMISRVRKTMGMDVALGELFVRPVLEDFARVLEQTAQAELSVIEPVERGGALALSFAQQRLWFIEQMGGIGSTYHMPIRLRLTGAMDGAALGGALARIVARHEALRTTFHLVDGEPVQRIVPVHRSGFLLLHHDLSGLPEAAEELAVIMASESETAFDLERGPLIRGRLVRLAADDHVLLVTMHHIVSDGWSLGVFVHELSTLYGAFLRHEADPLPRLPVQYVDYAAWQRKWVTGEVLRQQADYWRATLADAPELLELPTDHSRPAQQEFAGAMARIELDEDLTTELRALSRRHGTTLFMTLLAGWAAVLGRLAGQTDVVIGTPTANRGRSETEGLIGFFVNTLALRFDLGGSPTVTELLGHVKSRVLEAQQHQDIPFEQVVELAQPTRSLAHTPVFQVMFTWANAPEGRLELPGLTVGSVGPAQHTTAKFDLSLALQESGGKIVGAASYATALYEHATVERHMAYLRRVLEEMVADERREVDGLAMLPDAERARLVEEWNATDAEYPRGACVHELFEARAASTPNAVAIVFGDQWMTYDELNRRANRLAHHLRGRGVGTDGRVAIVLPRSPELVIAELAVLKAGAAYVPVDSSHPAERIAFMAADSAARVVLSRAGEAVPELAGVERIDVDAIPEGDDANLGVAPGGEALAYVMYTSGSTGEPKGVMVPHRAVTQFVLSNGQVRLGPDDRVALSNNPAFDASTMEVWGPLLHGGRIVVVPQEVLLDPNAFGALLRDEGVTMLLITPALFNPYTEIITAELAGLRYVLTGGDRAEPAAYARLLRAGPVQVLNCYGPTETTTYSLAHPVGEITDFAERIPVGRPNGNTRVYILDARGEPVAVGVAGELHIGGLGVARGYLNRPDLTAERFVADPFSREPGARMYRTGDLARWRVDGRVEFVGRTDAQVKIRGFRIELGEIESRLLEHEGVREAAVIAREDVPGDKRLVAYLVGDGGTEAQDLRVHLAENLPEYMVPAAYVWLDRLPITANGKLDRKALPAPEGDSFAARQYEAPVGETEETLAAIWAAVLGVERVGRWDNFFELGGHSLRAVTLVQRMRQRGLHAEVGALFTAPTLAELAEKVSGRSSEVIVPANLIAVLEPSGAATDSDESDDGEWYL